MGRNLIETSRWLLLASLVYAPWAYGCTVSWTAHLLDLLLGALILLWFAGYGIEHRRPSIGVTPIVCVALLLCQGWLMAWNAHFQHDRVLHLFTPLTNSWPHIPGTIDRTTSIHALLHYSAILGLFLVVCDLARRTVWRRRIIVTIALTGTSIILLGLLQKASAASMIFWQAGSTDSPFFGTYYYHGNAGAFINLVLPPIAAFAAQSVFASDKPQERALWIPSFLLCLAAAAVNVSRAASLISACLVCMLAFHEVLRIRKFHRPTTGLPVIAGVIFVIVALITISTSAGAGQAWSKWAWLRNQLNEDNPRFIAASVCLNMANDSGPCGFGPGTFAIAFPHYTNGLGDSIAGVWRFAHQDYLQAVIEWGWFGGACWFVLLFGAILRSFMPASHHHTDSRSQFVCGLALTGVAIHALVDFPLQIPSLQLYVATLAGIAWSGGSQRQREAYTTSEHFLWQTHPNVKRKNTDAAR